MTYANTTPPTGPTEPTGPADSAGQPGRARRLYPVTSPAHGPAAGDAATPEPLQDNEAGPSSGDLETRLAAQVTRARAWLPPVQDAVFDCYLGSLAAQLDPYTEADPIGVMASLLGAVGVHMGPGPHLRIGIERHPLLVWPMLIGHTGSGKKGTAYGAAKFLLTEADTEFIANIHSGLSSGEGLAAVFATRGDAEDGKRKAGPARLLPEGDCRLLAFEPEWASVMARMRREGNTLSATLRAAWEGGNLSTLNVDARVARRAHVGILPHITPGEFQAKVSGADLAGGTYNRFLPLAVAESKLLPDPEDADPALIEAMAAGLADRLHHAGQLGTLGFAPAGKTAWRELYLEFGTLPEHHQQLTEFTSRAAPHCLRIAAIYAALDKTPLITPAHLHAAAALVRYSIASAAAVLGANQNAAKLAAWITEAGEDGLTRNQARDLFGRNLRADQLTALLDELAAAGRITVTKRAPAGGRGKHAEVYVATPYAVNAVTR